jgi:hypothetical protein
MPGGLQPAAIGSALAERGIDPSKTRILKHGELTFAVYQPVRQRHRSGCSIALVPPRGWAARKFPQRGGNHGAVLHQHDKEHIRLIDGAAAASHQKILTDPIDSEEVLDEEEVQCTVWRAGQK